MRYRFVALLLLITACADGPDPFEFGPQFPTGSEESVRLTYSVNDDRTPAWSAASDSIYYAGGSYPPFPANQTLLFAAPRAGGIVQPIFATSEYGRPVYTAPAVASDGESLAFFEITRLWRYDCVIVVNAQFPEAPVDSAILPLLQQAVLHIRPLDRSANDAASLTVHFGGRNDPPSPEVIVVEGAPFQRVYGYYRAPIFRASWAPDGQRVVFSNGHQLMLWTIGAAAAVPIAGTDDGVWPAWSPDGQWIAFTRLIRGTPQRSQYNCISTTGDVVARYDVTFYEPPFGTPALGDIELIRPDGSEGRSLGLGEAPSWLPNSNELVFTRGDQLWRSGLDGSAATSIDGTAGGHEAAVSPDGAWVAFTRTTAMPNRRDVWVVPLP